MHLKKIILFVITFVFFIVGAFSQEFSQKQPKKENSPFQIKKERKQLANLQKLLKPDFRKLTQSYSNLADHYSVLNRNRKAIKYYHKTILIQQQLLDTLGLIRSYQKITQNYMALNKYDKAFHYNQMYYATLIKKYNDMHPGLVACYNTGCSILMKQGKRRDATNYCDASMQLQKELFKKKYPELKYCLEVYKNGMDDNLLTTHKLALKYYHKSEETLLNLLEPNDMLLTIPYGRLQQTYMKMQQYEKALAYFKKRDAIAKTLYDTKGNLHSFYRQKGQQAKINGDWSTAIAAYSTALSFCNQTKYCKKNQHHTY